MQVGVVVRIAAPAAALFFLSFTFLAFDACWGSGLCFKKKWGFHRTKWREMRSKFRGRCRTVEVNIGGDTVCLQGEYKIDTEEGGSYEAGLQGSWR